VEQRSLEEHGRAAVSVVIVGALGFPLSAEALGIGPVSRKGRFGQPCAGLQIPSHHVGLRKLRTNGGIGLYQSNIDVFSLASAPISLEFCRLWTVTRCLRGVTIRELSQGCQSTGAFLAGRAIHCSAHLDILLDEL